MTLAQKHHCSGCSACHDACPRGAISMVSDAEGFLYPQVDTERCVNCGICAKVCPSLNRPDPRTPLAVYAAKAKDTELRLASSSGGVFSLLARQILAKGGKVFGAAFDKKDWSVEHIGVTDEEGLAELRGSKYVQSRTAGIYREVKSALGANIPVLFSGTPCQIAALRAYLNSPTPTHYANLFLVDVACHGVPSPAVWQKYLDWQCEAASALGRGSAPAEGRNIRRISFRCKNCGWKRYSLSLRFANDKEYLRQFPEDPFMRAFLHELCNRPSCHDCQVRELRSGSDLTIADFWGIDRVMPDFDDDCGTSLVLANTEKGAALLNSITPDIELRQSTFNNALSGNSALVRSPTPHRNRAKFLEKCRAKNFDKFVARMLLPPFMIRIRTLIGRILRKLGFCK